MRWGLCCNEEFEKALVDIQQDTYHNGAGPLWMMDRNARPRRARAEQLGLPRAQSVWLVVWVFTREIKYIVV